MPVKHIPCGEFVNASERIATEAVIARLNKVAADAHWIVLSNVPFEYDRRRQTHDLDMICIGPQGVFVIEVKHWSRGYLKSQKATVGHEATKLQDKVKK